MDIWTTLRTSNSLLSKVTIYLPLTPRTCSGPAQNPVILTLILTILGPFEGPEEAAARPVRAAFGLEDLHRASQTHAGTSNLAILTTFPIEKSIFVILPIGGQWKCHFDPILTPFWALLSPNLWPPAKMCLFWPISPEGTFWGTLRDPILTLILTILDPFWGSWKEAAARPPRAAFGLEDLLRASQTHAWDLKFWSFWPLLDLPVRPRNALILTILALKPHDLAICSVQIGPFWRHLA